MTSSGLSRGGPGSGRLARRDRTGGAIGTGDPPGPKARAAAPAKGFCGGVPDGDVGSRRRGGPPRSYAASGVDLAGRARALPELLRAARFRAPASHGRVLAAPGHYAGLVRVGRETIAITTDTVGTKVLLAERLGRWEEVGEDAVAINVNDLASVGARPTAIVDTLLCAEAEPAVFRALGRGLRRGLAAARCSLVGGETALVAEIVRGLDLGATAVGYLPAGRRPILGDRIRPGDVLLGLRSSGLHANGFTLVRRLLEARRVPLQRPRPGASRPLGRELLTPTRTYSEVVDAVADDPAVVGLAHISGAGVRNLLRLHPRRRYVLDRWPNPPPLFAWLRQLGELEDREMYGTFNMGIGFVLIVRASGASRVLRGLARAGAADARPIGHVARGAGVELPSLGLRYASYA
jgi:phosphoribosylformylglycinamidine cyclo-ligase